MFMDQQTLILKQMKIELARRDPNAFCEYCFVDKNGDPWVQADFHREWQALLPLADGNQHFINIEAPREHAKTSQLAMARTIWELGRHPDLRIKIVTGEDDLGVDILNEITQNLEHNPKIHEVFPHLVPDKAQGWTRHKIYVQRKIIQKDASVQVFPVLSSKMGPRADLIFFDDVVNPRNAIFQPALRPVVKQMVREGWLNLLETDGRAVNTFTPWHLDDHNSELKKDGAWIQWSRPAIVDGEPLWGEKWTLDTLEQRRLAIGDRAYQRQFMLIPLSEEETTFSKQVVDGCIRHDLTLKTVYPPEWPRYVGIDLASSLGKKASYTVIFTAVVDPQGKKIPTEIIRRRLKFPELIRLIEMNGKKHQWNFGYTENNSFQDAVDAQLSDGGSGLSVQGFYTGSQKWDEQLGLPGLAADMGKGGWAIPKGCIGCGQAVCMCHGHGCGCVICEWEKELRFHPVNETADIVMAQWLCDQAIRKDRRGGKKEFIHLAGIWKEYDEQQRERESARV